METGRPGWESLLVSSKETGTDCWRGTWQVCAGTLRHLSSSCQPGRVEGYAGVHLVLAPVRCRSGPANGVESSGRSFRIFLNKAGRVQKHHL